MDGYGLAKFRKDDAHVARLLRSCSRCRTDMHLHFVLDEPQYNVLLEPLIEHARRARHTVTIGERTAQRYDADAYILIQDFGFFGCPEPKVLLTHALGLAKKVAFSLDVQLMIFPSSAYRDCVASEIPPETEVVAGVGSSKIDILLDRSQCREQIRERIRKTYGFDERPIVGYCPTFRHDGSLHHPQRSHRLRDVEQILEGNFNVIVLHHSLESDVSEVDELKFRLDPTIPRVNHLVALDFAVSDISGIGFELCAIDIPTVLLDEPSVPGYLEARIFQDGRRLDYGPTCSLAELAVDASRLFEAADGYQSQRAHWRRSPLDLAMERHQSVYWPRLCALRLIAKCECSSSRLRVIWHPQSVSQTLCRRSSSFLRSTGKRRKTRVACPCH